ncbi:hypothetical protein RNZ50_22805 [Paracoccaceae bacterium Fryx2]|nr:hypothetical protein [Paracoccaceae bacterium Fryx2]
MRKMPRSSRSRYIAAMALFGIAPMTMKTTALALNLLVAGIGTVHFYNAGRLAWRNVYPFAVLGFLLRDNHLGRCRQPPWPVGLNGRRACPSGGQPHRLE